ncbi:MAG: hypothetical protein RID11_08465 [Roseovarius sp.]|jgi:hypothetical protein|uniref:hypothetical protein n=1 Tax=Roseovarius sp. TaxID=1486281 RepID=UPI0032F00631
MIKPPRNNKSKDGWRALIEACAQLTPLTAFLSRIYATTFPSQSDREREEWEGEVSTILNDRLSGRLKTFGRVDFDGSRYSFGRSSNVSSITDLGSGCIKANLIRRFTENCVVDVQADDGVARVTQKSAADFSIEIRKDGERIDTGFVFIVHSCDDGV